MVCGGGQGGWDAFTLFVQGTRGCVLVERTAIAEDEEGDDEWWS
jgi:hypothetical protein